MEYRVRVNVVVSFLAEDAEQADRRVYRVARWAEHVMKNHKQSSLPGEPQVVDAETDLFTLNGNDQSLSEEYDLHKRKEGA